MDAKIRSELVRFSIAWNKREEMRREYLKTITSEPNNERKEHQARLNCYSADDQLSRRVDDLGKLLSNYRIAVDA